MPALYTHYTCGLLNYRSMQKGYLKECIKEAKHAYGIGLAGPDIFFYNFLDAVFLEKTAGSIMHVENCGLFLQNLYLEATKLKGREKIIAVAYLAGFVGHYELDCACHPLVYAQMEDETSKKSMGQHFVYEAAMDSYCCEAYLGKKMKEMNASVITALSHKEKKVIAGIVTNAFEKSFPNQKVSAFNMNIVLSFYKVVTMLILDPKGWKEKLLLPVDKLLFGTRFSTPLFINENRYDITKEQWEEFNVCFQEGLKELKKVTPYLEQALLDLNKRNSFYEVLGNKSYHTGEELNPATV